MEVAIDSDSLTRHGFEVVHRGISLLTASLDDCRRLGYNPGGQDFADNEHSWARHCKGD